MAVSDHQRRSKQHTIANRCKNCVGRTGQLLTVAVRGRCATIHIAFDLSSTAHILCAKLQAEPRSQ